MKIEMGESLFYSWLRHVKECRIVQTNWKVSEKWPMLHEEESGALLKEVETHFQNTYNYNIFKKNTSMSQIVRQGECDVVGVSFDGNERQIYAVDVAFHGAGLNYGRKDETVMKVIAKSVRTAICLYGYMDTKTAEIIFASPKINPAVMELLEPCISDLNDLLQKNGYEFSVRLIANDSFNELVLKPILLVSDGVEDTSELFMRSYQMYKMFAGNGKADMPGVKRSERHGISEKILSNRGMYSEIKIGQLVQTVLKPLIISKATEDEIKLMQDEEYSKNTFGIQYKLLLKTSAPTTEKHYYSDLFVINGETYRLCCEWFETAANNDRPYVEKWIREHEEQ